MKYEDEVSKWLTDHSDLHLVSGLAAECGEVCSLFQKTLYKQLDNVDGNHLIEELGDVLFYVSMLARKAGYSLEEVQQINIEKLRRRHGN